MFLDNFKVLAMHPSQYGETEVLEMKIDLVPGAILYKSIEPRSEREFTRSNRGVVRARSDRTFSEPLGLVPVKKKDGRTRWVTDLRELNK